MSNTVVPTRPDMESMKNERSDATIRTMLWLWDVIFKDNVELITDLPTVGNTTDDFRLVKENGFVYKWDGVTWFQADEPYDQEITLENDIAIGFTGFSSNSLFFNQFGSPESPQGSPMGGGIELKDDHSFTKNVFVSDVTGKVRIEWYGFNGILKDDMS